MAKPKHNNNGNDNTERPLIDLIRTILTDFIKEVRADLAALKNKEQERHSQIMTALETLTASVTAGTVGQAELTAAVNAAIVRLGSPGTTDAQLITLTAAVDALNASDVSLRDALNAALGNPVIIPPTEPV